MEKLIVTLGLIALFLQGGISIAAPASAVTSGLPCLVSKKNSNLAIDQRDDLRMQCLQKHVANLKLTSCLKISENMEYSFNTENSKVMCLHQAASKGQLGFETCRLLSQKLQYADTADEVRWLCLKGLAKRPSRKLCLNLAFKMEYPTNSDRAESFCRDELK